LPGRVWVARMAIAGRPARRRAADARDKLARIQSTGRIA
jgi:hypothetical protein